MMKQLLLSVTLAAAALTSTQLLADPAGRHQGHGQNTPCTGANCPAATAAPSEQHGQHGMGHGGMRGKMQAVRGEHPGKDAHGNHGNHGKHGTRGAQGGNAGEGCPMHGERKPA